MTNDRPITDPTAPPTLLIVDDEPSARQLLNAYLSRRGFQIIEAGTGEQALDAMRGERIPDLVLLDVMMPYVDGLEVLQNIRGRFQPAELPVILLTARGDKDDIVRGLELGANDYITKPVEVAELAARVRNLVRTKRLLEQNRMSYERLQELDELKDKFLQIAAHDLKSPLGTIMMGLQILEDAMPEISPALPEIDRVIGMMTYSTGVMESIINDYLDLQMIKTGRLELDMQTVSLNSQITTVVNQLRHYAESKEIRLEAELDPTMGSCPGDPERLAQVINNLVNNAIKFSPRGASVIARTLHRDGKVRVEVADSGPGIADHEIPLLFNEFTRLKNRPTGGEKSSGVGLAISRYLMNAHGGSLGVESTVGQGSTFWFELPCQA
jgi:two-component system, sensor histidine kinase and response regulator